MLIWLNQCKDAWIRIAYSYNAVVAEPVMLIAKSAVRSPPTACFSHLDQANRKIATCTETLSATPVILHSIKYGVIDDYMIGLAGGALSVDQEIGLSMNTGNVGLPDSIFRRMSQGRYQGRRRLKDCCLHWQFQLAFSFLVDVMGLTRWGNCMIYNK